ncbi:phage morphogenesis protein [Spirochaetia bacterium]|nr:phage morphogenesis protein [Spirochaetia bacterium]
MGRIPDPTEAKRYLSRKSIVETENWDDLKWGEHAHSFTVAHSRNAAVLDDIFGMLNKAQSEGQSIETFRTGMRDMMKKKGWYGRSDKGPDDRDYANWRINLIYHVNMRTAYEAGRYRQQVRGAELRPIWEYVSMLVGANRRQEHVALHGKAFRYDDPFWDMYRPPNGWGCECSVTTLSESGASLEGVEILSSDDDGNPPHLTDRQGNAVDWNNFAPEAWRYNPGRESVAPNFSTYKNLANYRMEDGRTALRHVVDRYREDMDGTRMTGGEFKVLVNRMEEKDYTPQNIIYQVGNLNAPRHEAMMKAGVDDSKIMATDLALYHGTADKNIGQKVPASRFDELYQTMQMPERIYENAQPRSSRFGREFHFVKSTQDGKVLKVVLRQKMPTTALRVITVGWVEDQYGQGSFKKIW